jgi:7-keto-8-aminopelargonate synthetase-like enzyme
VNDLILYDAISHTSIIQGAHHSGVETKAFPHNDFQSLREILKRTRKYYEKVLLVVEGVYSMDGDVAPIPEFVKLKKEFGLFLMVDEAHSTGVLGKTGRGVDEHFDLKTEDIDIRMGTLSKSIGSCGGFLAGQRALIEYLRYNLPGFVFSTGISPPVAAAALEGIRVLRGDPSRVTRLHHNIKYFLETAKRHKFNTLRAQLTPIIPILIGGDQPAYKICQHARNKGVFIVPAVFPAVPKNSSRLRYCITSEHTEEQLNRSLEILEEITEESKIPIPRISQRETA